MIFSPQLDVYEVALQDPTRIPWAISILKLINQGLTSHAEILFLNESHILRGYLAFGWLTINGLKERPTRRVMWVNVDDGTMSVETSPGAYGLVDLKIFISNPETMELNVGRKENERES